jgi:hypothetical protein
MDRNAVLAIVKTAVSRNGAELPLESISEATVLSHQPHIDGIGVDDFVYDLEETFGPMVWTIPWGRFSDQRASFRGWGCALFPLFLLWWFVTWPIRGSFIPPPNGGEEALTVGHLTDVLYAGHWFEPGEPA